MMNSPTSPQEVHECDRLGFYNVLYSRRDVRAEFLPDKIPHDVLMRVLDAAHHAPSVGLSQPWNFVVVDDQLVKKQVHRAFLGANAEAAEMFPEERRDHYRQLKLQGILEAPINLVITCDHSRGGQVVLGKTHQPETDLYSTVCAVQNLWLAARAEQLGVGWVSIIKPQALRSIFGLPDHITPVAYLCIGYVEFFRGEPELQEKNWAKRAPLDSLVFRNGWGLKGS
ncbi:5,6-dimethylbenzimidazole synthase [Porticoccus sp. W117]|uniref:5,6-dimethylbenzimidazole synthase n=1 Tax=Porticoccus sp. W117 TaxID=3054777 RepID=UPI00259860F8|nr:5,6-dimethylbenzimidazole synthase [Porticoccus sp. W117]MDM3871409.1 5,6-dimethylbenzimidazole synthase [Porticoccus sp. W117]